MLFERLTQACRDDWEAYTRHDFIRQLGDGSLPRPCFEHYLKQDYLFLIHFARAYALAIYKSRTLAQMRQAKASLDAILDSEMGLHIDYCRQWGIEERALEREPEAAATLAYTRYVLERGQAGNLLDLHTALAPCVVGYAEIARRLMGEPWVELKNNPYRSWIETYAADDYQQVAQAQVELLDELAGPEPASSRAEELAETFATATRLEAGFWEMGLKLLP